MVRAIGIAIALAAVGCGRGDKQEQTRRTPERPTIPRPTRAPAPLALDELLLVQPTLTGTRDATALAIDPSGKQGVEILCAAGADPAAVAQAIGDRYASGGWTMLVRTPTAFTADHALSSGVIHVQAQVHPAAPCTADEVRVVVSYTKLVPLPPPPR